MKCLKLFLVLILGSVVVYSQTQYDHQDMCSLRIAETDGHVTFRLDDFESFVETIWQDSLHIREIVDGIEYRVRYFHGMTIKQSLKDLSADILITGPNIRLINGWHSFGPESIATVLKSDYPKTYNGKKDNIVKVNISYLDPQTGLLTDSDTWLEIHLKKRGIIKSIKIKNIPRWRNWCLD